MDFLRARVKYLSEEALTIIKKVENQTIEQPEKRSVSEPPVDKT